MLSKACTWCSQPVPYLASPYAHRRAALFKDYSGGEHEGMSLDEFMSMNVFVGVLSSSAFREWRRNSKTLPHTDQYVVDAFVAACGGMATPGSTSTHGSMATHGSTSGYQTFCTAVAALDKTLVMPLPVRRCLRRDLSLRVIKL